MLINAERQILQTMIRWLLQEQADLGFHFLLKHNSSNISGTYDNKHKVDLKINDTNKMFKKVKTHKSLLIMFAKGR